jgi:hypothetical protein
LQEKTYNGPFPDFAAAWQDSVSSKYSWGHSGANPFQMDADNSGRWLMHYSPYPYQTYSLVLGPAILTASLPTIYENRKGGDDFWRDLDRAER